MTTTPRELLEHYRQGRNITALLRDERGAEGNTEAIIEVAYDLQTGSYIESMRDPEMAEHKRRYAAELAGTLVGLGGFESVLEAGIGEGTTLSGVLDNLGPVTAYGFDLSWSRVAFARRWLRTCGHDSVHLCTGSLLAMPFADDSVDVVFTSHAVEPNGGREAAILAELTRVARRFVVLWEPSYAHASEAGRRRMDAHGYCRNLPETAETLGLRVLEHRALRESANPLNPTAVTVIQCEPPADVAPKHPWACPQHRTPLRSLGGMLFSPEGLAVYPVLGGIPCLRAENAVVASRYADVVGEDDAPQPSVGEGGALCDDGGVE